MATSELISRPYRPDPMQCCDACVWGTGEHAEFCEFFSMKIIDWLRRHGSRIPLEQVELPDDFRRDVDPVIREGKKPISGIDSVWVQADQCRDRMEAQGLKMRWPDHPPEFYEKLRRDDELTRAIADKRRKPWE